jgi:hypothetical protein
MEAHEITAPGVRLHYVRVTNRGDVPFTDRHDGVPVSIPPGKSDNFPLDMAAHFFGDVTDPQAMFRHVCRRQGWNTPAHLKPTESGKTLAEEMFSKLDIKPVVYKMVEEKPDLEQPIPADPPPPPVKAVPAPEPVVAEQDEDDEDDLPVRPRRKG